MTDKKKFGPETRTYSYSEGKVPGPGIAWDKKSTNPGGGLARKQMEDILLINHTGPLTKALEKLRIEPIYYGSWSMGYVNNGGKSFQRGETPYYAKDVVLRIREELDKFSRPTGKPKVRKYRGVTYTQY
jgi:hypothetical protein